MMRRFCANRKPPSEEDKTLFQTHTFFNHSLSHAPIQFLRLSHAPFQRLELIPPQTSVPSPTKLIPKTQKTQKKKRKKCRLNFQVSARPPPLLLTELQTGTPSQNLPLIFYLFFLFSCLSFQFLCFYLFL